MVGCSGPKAFEPPSNQTAQPTVEAAGSGWADGTRAADTAGTSRPSGPGASGANPGTSGPGASGASNVTLRVTGIDPPRGDAGGGTYVVIKGGGFIKDGSRQIKVYFGSAQGTVVRFQSDREVIVQAPGGKPNDVVDVLVIFDPGGQLKIPKAFTFVDRPGGSSVDDLDNK